jgi:BirA family biotin operon repressor/biotin-[acetyl-CoA-carboxylase] ligase
LFNIEEFDIKLDTEVIGRNFIYCEEVDSTNSVLLTSKEFEKHGTVLLAEQQSKGRGRKERTWTSNSFQNLTFSILLLKKFKENRINIVNLATSLAVAQSIENLYQLKVTLKWPNDILVNGRKAAGILLESTSKGNKIEKVIIGVGINANQTNFSGKFNITPTSIRNEFREQISREKLLSEILNNFEEILESSHYNPEKILSDWKSRCKMLGEKIKIEEDGKTKIGIFEDVDENGFLVLKTGDKQEKIHFGDVSLIV